MLVKLDDFPRVRDENEKYLSCHHLGNHWVFCFPPCFFGWVDVLASLQKKKWENLRIEVEESRNWIHIPPIEGHGLLRLRIVGSKPTRLESEVTWGW